MLQIINYVLQCTKDTDTNINAFNNGNIEQFISKDGILTVPCGVTEITDKVSNYANKDNIIKVQIPDSVITIGDNAFKECQNIQSVSIPDTVTDIGELAFFDCTSLSIVNIPTSLTILKAGVFGNCNSLTEIIIPMNIKEGQTKGLIINGYLTDYGPFSYSGLQEINLQYGLTSIGNYLFFVCKKLTTIKIPDTVTSIGKSAFLGCTGLISIVIPDSVTSMGSHAFYTCDHLESIIMSNSITTIEQNTFRWCFNLITVRLPNKLTTIKSNAFYECKSLQSINIPKTVTTIEDHAFFCCEQIQSISIPQGVTTIDVETFWNCTSLITVVLPDSITIIKDHAFSGCENLKNINIPDTITSIEDAAFNRCQTLQTFTIPSGITTISGGTFHLCINLQTVFIPNSVTQIGTTAFQQCTSLKTIVIPDSVTAIKQEAFEDCTSLTCVQIGSKSCQINLYAFNNTKYNGFTDPSQFDDQCEVNIYTECKNDSSDYHDPNSDKCVIEVYVDHYVVQDGIKYYYEQCPDTHKLSVEGSKECISECPQYYEENENICISNPCLNPNNFYISEYISDFKQCMENCDKVWLQQNVDEKSVKICFIEKDNCQSVEGYTKQINNQCVSKCSDFNDYYQQSSTDNNCIKGCNNGKTGDELIQYVWYYDDDNVCTTQTICSSDPDGQTNGYGKQIGQQCVQYCKDKGYFQKDKNSGNVCVQQCDNNKVWFVYNSRSENQKENMCTELEKCELSSLVGYENLDKNQNQQCVEKCLGEGNQIEYVYYYESDEKGNICTQSVICQIQSHPELQYTLDQQCVTKCIEQQFVQDTDNKCLTQCSKIDDKQLYQYQDDQNNNIICTEKSCQQLSSDISKYYIYEMTDNQIYCTLSCTTDKTNDKPYIFISGDQEKCVSQCPDGYKVNDSQQCVEEKQEDNNKLSAGQIAGIVIGVVAVIVIIIITIVCIKKRKQNLPDKEAKSMTSRVVEKA